MYDREICAGKACCLQCPAQLFHAQSCAVTSSKQNDRGARFIRKKAKKYNFASRTANGKAGDEAGDY